MIRDIGIFFFHILNYFLEFLLYVGIYSLKGENRQGFLSKYYPSTGQVEGGDLDKNQRLDLANLGVKTIFDESKD